MPALPWNAPAPRRAPHLISGRSRNALLAASFLALVAATIVSPHAHAQCTKVEIQGVKWCGVSDIPYYFGAGLNGNCTILSNRECWYWKNAINAAVYDWNLIAISDLDSPFQLTYAGTLGAGALPPDGFGIVFSLGDLQLGTYPDCSPGIPSSGETGLCGGTVPPGQHWGLTHYNYTIPSSGDLGFLESACIHFADPLDVQWTDGGGDGIDRKTVALHEIGHALGLGHGNGDGCLMEDGIYGGCGDVMDIDGASIAALACLYGSLFGPCSDSWSIFPYTDTQGDPAFMLGYCDCTGACGTPKLPKQPYTYELAVSESGGPYQTFATLDDSDFVGNTYTHAFSQAYAAASIRLRVFDGGSQVGETFSAFRIAITATATASPPVTLGALAVTSAPNPAGVRVDLALDLPRAAHVQVDVYDVAGRRIRTIHRGDLPAGLRQLSWDGRLDDGSAAASGVYRYVVKAGGQEAVGRIVWIR